MKKLLLIALLIMGCVFGEETKPNIIDLSDREKNINYIENRKSPFFAGLLASTSIPPIPIYLGHLYNGNWKRGFSSFYVALPLGIASGSYAYTESETGVHNDQKGWFLGLAILSLVIYYPLQWQDAVYLAKQHNSDLYKQIFGKETFLPPKKSILQKIIDKKKLKKQQWIDKKSN